MTSQATAANGMEKGPPTLFNRPIVVTPPFVSDTELGVTAVDIFLSGALPSRASGFAAICLGGHPPAECLLDAVGAGTDHQIVVAIDETQPRHHQFASRIRGMVKPEKPVQVIPLPSEPQTSADYRLE